MTAVDTEPTFWSEKESISKECCCCSRDNCVKDIYTEYYDTGVREMYSEMILDTFNIDINHKECNMKLYICNLCIIQLKNAYVFKRNMLKNYEAMLERIKKCNDQLKHDIKCETNQFEDDYEGISEDIVYSDADISINGLKRKKLETNINLVKKENVETTDLKFVKKSETTRKRAKSKKEVSQNKMKDDLDNKQTTKIIQNKYRIVAKSTILRENSLKIIKNSSVWVFNWSEGRYRCFCCRQPYSDIKLLKEHTKTHKIEEISAKIQNSENNLVKVEVSDINCNICQQNFANLPSLINHLNTHNIKITDHILVPIKINDLTCQICSEKHTNFYILYRHMVRHYETLICDQCGVGFYQKRHLKQHIRKKHSPNQIDKTKKRDLKCCFCSERFKQFHLRIVHMVEKHDMEKPEFPCNLCTKVYITKGILNAHIKNSHNIKDSVYKCDICLKIFPRKQNLMRHMETHTEGLNYNCNVCNHRFKLKTSLKRHMKQKHKSET